MARDHDHYSEDLAPYVLGALTELEAEALEKHLRSCPDCRRELVELQTGAEALGRSVVQLEPSAELRARLLEEMDGAAAPAEQAREASAGAGAAGLETTRRGRARAALAGLRPRPRRSRDSLLPRPVLVPATGLLVLAAGVGGWAIGSAGTAGTAEEARTVAASIDRGRVPNASGELTLTAEGEEPVLRLTGLRDLGAGRTYEVWVQRKGDLAPGPLFSPTADGAAVTGVPGDPAGIEAVFVTRERAGGVRAPTETPIVSVPISS